MSFLFPNPRNTGHSRAENRGGSLPPTLLQNVRAHPLTFVGACLGLFTVLAVKTLVVRSRETTGQR